MSIEAKPSLVDYWHDLYLHEVCLRHSVLAALALPISAEGRLDEIKRLLTSLRQ